MKDFVWDQEGYLNLLQLLENGKECMAKPDAPDTDYHYQKTPMDASDKSESGFSSDSGSDGMSELSLSDLEKFLPKGYKVVGFKGGAVQVVKETDEYVDFVEAKSSYQNISGV